MSVCRHTLLVWGRAAATSQKFSVSARVSGGEPPSLPASLCVSVCGSLYLPRFRVSAAVVCPTETEKQPTEAERRRTKTGERPIETEQRITEPEKRNERRTETETHTQTGEHTDSQVLLNMCFLDGNKDTKGDSRPLTADAAGELNVLGHDGDALGVDGLHQP